MKTLRYILPTVIMLVRIANSQVVSVDFVNPIPAGYDPALQIPQFADVCPDMTLPDRHIYVKPSTREDWTTVQVMKKGITHWTHGDTGDDAYFRATPAYATKAYNNVPNIRQIFGLTYTNGTYWPNGLFDEAQTRLKARQCDISSRLWVAQTMEGDDYVEEHEPMWGWFYDELIDRYDAQMAEDGVPYYVAHNYFTRWPNVFNLGMEARATHQALYDTNWTNWPATLYTPGQTIGRPNTVLEGIYLNAPDILPLQVMNALWHMELAAKMGKFTGLFIFNVLEWHPGFVAQVNYPGEGTFYRSDKAHLDPNIQIAVAFLAQEYGTIFMEWGHRRLQPVSKKPITYFNEVHDGKDFWFPSGHESPANPCPFYQRGEPHQYSAGQACLGDMPHFGTVLWNMTGGEVAQGTAAYATYRLDGENWIERQANGSDLVAAYFEKRGVTKVRILGNRMLICYFNLFADNLPHTVEVQNPLNPAQTFTGSVCGIGVHAVVVDI